MTIEPSAPSRLLVIGLDAATYDLIEPWAEEGLLPTFAALLRSSAYGPLRSVPNLNSAASWSSFSTGKNPAKHGIFWFYERRAGGYDVRYLSGADNREPRFWDVYSEADRPVVVFNVPLTYPAYPLQGVMVGGMETPSVSAAGFAYPPEVGAEILRAVPDYTIETDAVVLARNNRWDQAVQALHHLVDSHLAAAEYLIANKPWELFVAVLTVLDRVQHTFWRHMDPEQPGNDPAVSAPYRNTILEMYQATDRAVARLMAHCDANTYLLLVSDHGMGRNQMGSFMLNPLLEQAGLFYRQQAAGGWQDSWRALLHWAMRNVAPRIEGWIPRSLRRRLMKLIPGGRAAVTQALHQNNPDWTRTRVYTDYVRPELWINLQGREPQGVVAPGDEYEQLRDQVIRLLVQCRDLETDRPIVNHVWKREEVYAGPFLAKAPDLIIDWNYDVVVKGVRWQDAEGRVRVVREREEIVERRDVSGDHRPDGIFLLHGPGVKPGRIEGQSIIDIAPTILYLAQLPIPAGTDGRVIAGALQDHDPARERWSAEEEPARPQGEAAQFSAQDETVVEERLKALGYL